MQLAQLVVHNSTQPGRRPPSQFTGALQQALDGGPVPPLLNDMEYEEVQLQSIMTAPLRFHPIEDLYRVLGFGPSRDEESKAPVADMVSGFLDGCSDALTHGGLQALKHLGEDVETGGRKLLIQVCGRSQERRYEYTLQGPIDCGSFESQMVQISSGGRAQILFVLTHDLGKTQITLCCAVSVAFASESNIGSHNIKYRENTEAFFLSFSSSSVSMKTVSRFHILLSAMDKEAVIFPGSTQ